MVKGWSRCVAAVSLLLYSYESPEVLKAWCFAITNFASSLFYMLHKGSLGLVLMVPGLA